MASADIVIMCNGCLKDTYHRIVLEHSISEGDEHVQSSTSYQIVECLGCRNITYRTVRLCSEWMDEDGDYYPECTYYPPLVSRKEPVWFKELPHDIQSVLSELYIALHAKSHYLATFGARTVLDLLITKKIGDVGTFQQKLAKLKSEKHISTEEANLIEVVIEAGNASVHRGFSPDGKSLKHVLDILETVLYKFYAEEGHRQKLAANAAALRKRIPPRNS